MFLKSSPIVFLVLLLGSAGTAIADDDWTAGKQAFASGDFESALVYFESARNAGRHGPAVHYNIAVSQHRTGRYGEARATFNYIASQYPEKRALAIYNIGLADVRLGDFNAARESFRRAYELANDDQNLRTLASRQLRTLEPEVRTAARWAGSLGVRAGTDDNVALLDEAGLTAGTETESPLAEVFASFSGPWSGESGLRVEGSAYLVKYTDADDFDQSLLSGGVFYDWRPGNWRIQMGVQASTGAIGGEAYDRKAGPRVRIAHFLSRNSNIELRYRYDDVSEADSIFAGLAGSRQIVDARYRFYNNGHFLQLRVAAETNDRLDAGMSPDRSRFGIDYRYQPERGLGFEAAVAIRNSEFADVLEPREEDLTTLRAAATYAFGNDWLVLTELRNYSNDSTDPLYSYDRAQLSLGLRKYF